MKQLYYLRAEKEFLRKLIFQEVINESIESQEVLEITILIKESKEIREQYANIEKNPDQTAREDIDKLIKLIDNFTDETVNNYLNKAQNSRNKKIVKEIQTKALRIKQKAELLYGNIEKNKEINLEIPEHKKISIHAETPINYLKSKYIATTLYYSENFLKNKIPERAKNGDREAQIIHKIKNELDKKPKIIQKYIQALTSKSLENKNFADFKTTYKPLRVIDPGRGVSHKDALDLFIQEGSTVRSMTSGLVVVVERNWKKGEPLSSSSDRGGNFVIIFNPKTKEFFRYVHLQRVNPNLEAGKIVMGGENIGTVGSTGKNASKPGHGNHLHLEINQFDGEKMIYKNRNYILQRVKNAKVDF